jgi:hypothetical protein
VRWRAAKVGSDRELGRAGKTEGVSRRSESMQGTARILRVHSKERSPAVKRLDASAHACVGEESKESDGFS